jgi:hypothetical protein
MPLAGAVRVTTGAGFSRTTVKPRLAPPVFPARSLTVTLRLWAPAGSGCGGTQAAAAAPTWQAAVMSAPSSSTWRVVGSTPEVASEYDTAIGGCAVPATVAGGETISTTGGTVSTVKPQLALAELPARSWRVSTTA